jgi:hypothetical protein
MFKCSKCDRDFNKHKSMLIHRYECRFEKCSSCKKVFKDKLNYIQHLPACKRRNIQDLGLSDVFTFRLHRVAYKSVLAIFVKEGKWSSLENLFSTEQQNIFNLLHHALYKLNSIKAQACLLISFAKQKPDGDMDTNEIYKVSLVKQVTHASQFEALVKGWIENLELVVDQFTQRGSGWVLKEIKVIEVRIGQLKENSGGCNMIELPPSLLRKRSLISPKCRQHCFKWCVLLAFHSQPYLRGRKRSLKRYESLYNFKGIESITPFSSIKVFENRNNVSINVYTWTDSRKPKIVPLLINKDRKAKHANLFLYNDHYFFISNFAGFCRNNNTWERFFCYSCLSGFRTQQHLSKHEILCKDNTAQRIILPGQENVPTTCQFTKVEKTIAYPYVIYADFEALATKSDKKLTTNTFEYQKHEACSFGWIAVDWNEKILFSDFYRGNDAAQKFIESLLELKTKLEHHLNQNQKPIIATQSEINKCLAAINCHVCSMPLLNDRVMDHCHLTGKLRGAAHNECNLKLRLPYRLPVIFHNLKGYDAHLIIKGLRSDLVRKISVIPQNTEKYIAFFMDDFMFLDSLAFLLSSLDSLASNLPIQDKTKYMNQLFSDNDIPLLLEKGCLPYEYMDSEERFDETSLPPISMFYSHLSKKTIDENCYNRLQSIWNHFNCRNLGDFHDIYLKVDVLLLTAIFQNFRATSIEKFGLDPCHYFSTPGLTWDAALKLTKTKLDLLTDIDMVLMIEKGIRGGISCAMSRHAIANNQQAENYDPTKPTSYITYLDVNNLYGYALNDVMPMKHFQWVDADNFDTVIDEIKMNESSDVGYICEVDLIYPDHLHDVHNDYPMAPEKLSVETEWLSEYQKALCIKLEQAGLKRYKTDKLIPNLMNKERYVVHERNLKFYLEKGMVLSKVHRMIRFNQGPWLKPYIEMCTQNRQKAVTKFEKDFWKLMVNSLYGKSIEDKRKHTRVKVVTNGRQALQQIRKPMFDQFFILENDLAIIKLRKFEVKLDKPIYLGFTVLELSKLHMYKLHYDYFLPRYGENLSLVYTDTDSFIYHIRTNDIHADLQEMSEIMDFSDYPQDHFLFNDSNKKKLGYLKDEMNGQTIDEVIAIKSKLYAIKYGSKKKLTAKGVQKATVKDEISIDDYRKCLYESLIYNHVNHRLESKHHQISAVRIQKVSLSPMDDKRYINADGITTLAFGNYKIVNT